MKLYCEHEIDMSAEDFWSIIHADSYEDKVTELLPLNEMTTLEKKEDDKAVYRKLKVMPHMAPAMEKLMSKLPGKASAGYLEEQWRYKDRMAVRFDMTPDMLGRKASISGEVRIEPRGENKCVRILDGEVKVKLLGLGKIVEKAIVSQTIDSYGITANIANEHKDEFLK